MNITYYAPDDTMGDTYREDCESFRDWAAWQISAEYPNHHVAVLDEPGSAQVETDDEERREEIADFCARLWGRCPWDFT